MVWCVAPLLLSCPFCSPPARPAPALHAPAARVRTVMLGLEISKVLFLSSSFQPSSSRAFSEMAVFTGEGGVEKRERGGGEATQRVVRNEPRARARSRATNCCVAPWLLLLRCLVAVFARLPRPPPPSALPDPARGSVVAFKGHSRRGAVAGGRARDADRSKEKHRTWRGAGKCASSARRRGHASAPCCLRPAASALSGAATCVCVHQAGGA